MKERKARVEIIDFYGYPDKFYASLYNKGYGEKQGSAYLLDLYEVAYLKELEWIEAYKDGKKLSLKQIIDLGKEWTERFYLKYLVYKDLRKRGFVPKTALKYGADFRVYDTTRFRQERVHSKFLVLVLHEEDHISAKSFAAVHRIANTVNKYVVLALVDNEGDITYYESRWTRLQVS
jgi:tRNA-intron endonuclease